MKEDLKLSILLVGIDSPEVEVVSDILSFSFEKIRHKPFEEARSNPHLNADFILLNMDNDLNGAIELGSRLRGQTFYDQVPLVAITSSADSDARMKIYKAGFDDCIQKPYRPLELLARVEAKLRWVRKTSGAGEVLRCGNLELNKPSFEARVGDRPVRLTSLEVKLLDYFMNNKSKVLSRQEILNSVWNSTVVLDRTVDSHIVTLRKKLEGSDHAVKTVFGAGYVFEMCN